MPAASGKALHDYNSAEVAAREDRAAQLLKQDPVLASAFNVAIHIAIAEGFASRVRDATTIIRPAPTSALLHEQVDVRPLGLQEAIEAAVPRASMSVFDNMVMMKRPNVGFI